MKAGNKIREYHLVEKTAGTAAWDLFRARKDDTSEPLMIRVLKTGAFSTSGFARFSREIRRIMALDSPMVVRTIDLIIQDGEIALVHEDFGSVPLARLLMDQRALPARSFLILAIKIAEALRDVHRGAVIHRAVSAENILVDPATGSVKLTGFGLSSILFPYEEDCFQNDTVGNLLAYISPEQTGRMNRILDYRSDLYSLGIVFYQMLTGTLPFRSDDPLEMIHSHLASLPTAAVKLDPGIPDMISAIAMKLLSKNPEDRYQSAHGLLSDLEECLARLEAEGVISGFVLAEKDSPRSFIIPRRLFGRDEETKRMISSFDRLLSRTGTGSAAEPRPIMFLLVTGPSGIGKSALINELRNEATARHGFFVSGKYQQFRRDKPYSGIIQAFQGLVRQILTGGDEMIDEWKEKIETAIGSNGRIITDIIPEAELIIGPQPQPADLGPDESRNRFNFVFGRFAGIFPGHDRPVVLFLDDLQWADTASITLLRNLLSNTEIRYLYLVGSYRESEEGDIHAITGLAESISKTGVPVERLDLGPLDEPAIIEFIRDVFRCQPGEARSLGSLVSRKTGGNPFFTIQFLKTLCDNGAIFFDETSGWRWDLEAIESSRATENVVDLLTGKISRLGPDTIAALRICACVGNRFDLETLSDCTGKTADESLAGLSEAIDAELVVASGSLFRFQHDRIQEAAYLLVPPGERRVLHYRIGKSALDKARRENNLSKKLFYITDQLNMSLDMIAGADEKAEVAQLNLEAGLRAKSSSAYAPASRYFATAIGLLGEGLWTGYYDLSLSLYTAAIETAYLMGDYGALNTLSSATLEHARSALDRVGILVSRINAMLSREDFRGAVAEGLKALRLFGIRIPSRPSRTRLGMELVKTMIALRGKKAEELLRLPGMTDPEMLAAMRIFAGMAHASFYGNPNLLAMVIIRAFRISLKYGNSPEHAFFHSGFGIIRAVALWDFAGADSFGKLGLALAEKIGAREQECKTIFVYNSQIRHWCAPMADTIGAMKEGYRIGLETGDLDYACFNLLFSDVNSLLHGMELPELEETMAANNRAIAALNQKHALTLHSLAWQAVLNLTGRSEDHLVLTGAALDEVRSLSSWREADNRTAICVYWFIKLILYTLFGDYRRALGASSEFDRHKDTIQGVLINLYAVFDDAIVRLFLYRESSLVGKIKHRARIFVNRARMRKWAESAPSNFSSMLHILDALHAWHVRGNTEKAMIEFEQSALIAGRNGDTIVESIACEFAALCMNSTGDAERAGAYMSKAVSCYSRWGATVKLAELVQRYPDLVSPPVAPASGGRGPAILDIATVIKMSQTLSGEMDSEKLPATIMELSLENAGARRGFLILQSEIDGKLYIEASGTAGSDIKILEKTALDGNVSLALSIVNYVWNTGESAVLFDATADERFLGDPYIAASNPRSVLCAPIRHKGSMAGILYLENDLVAGAFTPERLELLHILAAQAAISIENSRLLAHREREAKLRTEMKIAADIQSALLPENPVVEGYEIAARLVPIDEVGGDYYDVINTSERDWVIIGDVSGHGVHAGLIMMMVQTSIQTMVRNRPDLRPSELLTMVNEAIKYNIGRMKNDKYMTVTAFSLGRDGRTLHSGMHQNIYVYRAAAGDVEKIPSNGLWLSPWDLGRESVDGELMLGRGDMMLLFSDGLTEAPADDGTEYSEDSLPDILRGNGSSGAGEVLGKIFERLRNYTVKDDVTVLVVKKL